MNRTVRTKDKHSDNGDISRRAREGRASQRMPSAGGASRVLSRHVRRVLCACGLLLLSSFAMNDTRLLAPCPSSPNCVSSLATDERHRVEPLPGYADRAGSLKLLSDVLATLPRVSFEQVGPARLQARFTSRVLRFVDDVTFYVHENGGIEVRSASRVGYYDFGANRRRVEDLRERLEERLGDLTPVQGQGAG